MKKVNLVSALAAAYILVASGIVVFWVGFHTGIIFPLELMRERIAHFEGYYAWERAFTVPDCILAGCMVFGAVRLLRDQQDRPAITILKAASGACLFLGLLDFVYAVSNGMFFLGHSFSCALAMNIVVLIPFSLISLMILHKRVGG